MYTSTTVWAQRYDNITKQYTLTSKLEAFRESKRTQRRVLCDFHPTGLYVRKGEQLTIEVSWLQEPYILRAEIGFKTLWGKNHPPAQQVQLKQGMNTVTAERDGVLVLTFVNNKADFEPEPQTTTVKINGGEAFPLYQHRVTPEQQWKSQLASLKQSLWVQLVSDKALITIPYKDYLEKPIRNLGNTFDTIHRVLAREEELAGFQGTSAQHAPTRLLTHFIVDMSAPPEELKFYMYAGTYHIGMKQGNFTELTDPRELSNGWGIWHEIGHTHQQPSWRWGAIGEVSNNVFCLEMKEYFGSPTPFIKKEKQGYDLFENTRRYFATPDRDYNTSTMGDCNPLFTKLIMFWQLRMAYGWEVHKKLYRYFREHPEMTGKDDQQRVDYYVYVMCLLTGNDLRKFYDTWGLKITDSTRKKIGDMRLAMPARDPATILEDPWKPKPIDVSKYVADIVRAENNFRLKNGLKPLELKQELVAEANGQVEEMKNNGGDIFGDYNSRFKRINEKLGDMARPEFHMSTITFRDPEALVNKWIEEKKGAWQNMGRPYSYTGIGVAQGGENIYVAQYFAYSQAEKTAKQLADDILSAENKYRVSRGLKPYRSLPLLVDESQLQCKDMQAAGRFAYGNYKDRLNNINSRLGNSRPNFNMQVNEDGNAKTILDNWLNDKGGGPRICLDGEYDYTGIGVIKDNGKFYIAQYFAYRPDVKTMADEILSLQNEHRKKLGLKPLTVMPLIERRCIEHSAEMVKANNTIFGAYATREKEMREEIGGNVTLNFHMLIDDLGSAKAIMERWLNEPKATNRINFEGTYTHTGIGIIDANGRYYFTQYFAEKK